MLTNAIPFFSEEQVQTFTAYSTEIMDESKKSFIFGSKGQTEEEISKNLTKIMDAADKIFSNEPLGYSYHVNPPPPQAPREVWSIKDKSNPNKLCHDGNLNSLHKNALICYHSSGIVDGFFRKTFHRNTLNKSHEVAQIMKVYIEHKEIFDNPYWHIDSVYFGSTNLKLFKKPFEQEIDILAHEFGHGFIQHSGKLEYRHQSGALNESIADTIAIMVKQFLQKQNAHESNWLMGEVFLDSSKGLALRSFREPGKAYIKDSQEMVYRKMPIYEDHGGVHKFSCIPSKAFYLAATKMGGYVWGDVGQSWLRAVHLTNNDDFASFAQKTQRAAKEMKLGEGVENIIGQAWTEVGVLPQEIPQEITRRGFATRTNRYNKRQQIDDMYLNEITPDVIKKIPTEKIRLRAINRDSEHSFERKLLELEEKPKDKRKCPPCTII